MREAAKYDKSEGRVTDEEFERKTRTLNRGVPRGGVGMEKSMLKCYGCGEEKPRAQLMRLECAQCLEIYKERELKVATDCFERAFFCSEKCYCENWKTHKFRHGPSYSRLTKDDGVIHRFEAVETCGALWDGVLLKRLHFHDCEPVTEWPEEDEKKNDDKYEKDEVEVVVVLEEEEYV